MFWESIEMPSGRLNELSSIPFASMAMRPEEYRPSSVYSSTRIHARGGAARNAMALTPAGASAPCG
jgi:hypothetical protein